MRRRVFAIVIVLVLLLHFDAFSEAIKFTREPTTPPRIIRVCCSFGSNVGIVGVPFFKLTEITGVDNIGKHQYLGGKSEGNGIIYTRCGGFLDLAHLRDHADWTAYLYHLISIHKGDQNFQVKLGHEGGAKLLTLHIPDDLSDEDQMVLAGRIAYDLSVWHEIATWYGANSVPLIPERYSSFSIEDNYSNLLGVILGIEALKSDRPYNEAMTQLLAQKLDELGRVDSISQTYDAMEKVLNKWWTRDYRFPQADVTLKRAYSTYTDTYPLLVNELATPTDNACVLKIPELSDNCYTFDDLYTLQMKLSARMMCNRYFLKLKLRNITNRDFLKVVNEINIESDIVLSRVAHRYQF